MGKEERGGGEVISVTDSEWPQVSFVVVVVSFCCVFGLRIPRLLGDVTTPCLSAVKFNKEAETQSAIFCCWVLLFHEELLESGFNWKKEKKRLKVTWYCTQILTL